MTGRYRDVDYRAQRLNQPPRGYHYLRDDNTGDIILAAIAAGLIAALIFNWSRSSNGPASTGPDHGVPEQASGAVLHLHSRRAAIPA